MKEQKKEFLQVKLPKEKSVLMQVQRKKDGFLRDSYEYARSECQWKL